MIRNINGEIFTTEELLNKKIDEIQINLESTQELVKRIDTLELSLVKTLKYIQLQHRLDGFYEEIMKYLPRDKQNMLVDMDDCITDLLVTYGEYFYKNGYYDGKESKEAIKWKLTQKGSM